MTPSVPELRLGRGISAAPAAFSKRHFPALDGLRGIAILLVMLFHFTRPISEQGTSFSKLLGKIPHFGWCGVDLFFVLSGFLITGILLDSKAEKGYFWNFYVRRTLRIFPLYFGVLIVAFLLIPVIWPFTEASDLRQAAHQGSLWFYWTNFDIALNGWVHNGERMNTSHFWSLAVEEQFYLVWPLVVLLCNRRVLMALCMACICGALGLRLYFVHSAADLLTPYVITPCRIDALAWGSLVAAAVRGLGGAEALVRPAKWVLAVSGLVLVGTVARLGYFGNGHPFVVTVGFSALGAFFAGVVLLAIVSSEKSLAGRLCRNGALRATGKIAYGLYVFHYLVLPTVDDLFPAACRYMPQPLAVVVYLTVAFALAFGISILSWHLYEKHFLRMKDWLAPVARDSVVVPVRVG